MENSGLHRFVRANPQSPFHRFFLHKPLGKIPNGTGEGPFLRFWHCHGRCVYPAFDDVLVWSAPYERVIIALTHDADILGRIVCEFQGIQSVIVSRPIDETERKLSLPTGNFQFFDLGPIALVNSVADGEMVPVYIQTEKVQAAHVHLLEPRLQGIDPGDQINE